MNDALVQTRPVITLMAQNGGVPAPSRRFTVPGRAVAASPSSSPPLPSPPTLPPSAAMATVSPNASPAALLRDRITLCQPRPDSNRLPNYYTETPFRPDIIVQSSRNKGAKDTEDDRVPVHLATRGTVDTSRPSRPLLLSASSVGQQQQSQQPNTVFHPVVTTQPSMITFAGVKENSKKKPQQTLSPGHQQQLMDQSTDPRLLGQEHQESILCSECGRCKCEACRKPRRLPNRWICHDNYECSAEVLLDTCTCMCCVKALFYHCTKDCEGANDEVSCADKPCSCGPQRRCQRWGCMGLLALALPCLLCYWPAKGCVRLCELCYARYHRHGCQCTSTQRRRQDATTTSSPGGGDASPPNKRLLDPN